MAADRRKIIERIQALLNMTVERGATENEAMVAAEKAQELLLRYNIEMAEVEKASGAKGEPITEESWESLVNQSGWNALARGCSRANFCDYFIQGNAFVFVGRESNAQVARYLFVYLSRAINQASEDAWANDWLLAQFGGGESADFHRHNKRFWLAAFCEAACNRLNKRLLEAAGQVQQQQPGLIVSLGNEISEYLKRYRWHTVSSRGAAFIGSATRSGDQAGSNINWREGIQPNPSAPRLGSGSS